MISSTPNGPQAKAGGSSSQLDASKKTTPALTTGADQEVQERSFDTDIVPQSEQIGDSPAETFGNEAKEDSRKKDKTIPFPGQRVMISSQASRTKC
jgi:uncharacterized protein YycO